jgi:hypothetical protein
VKGSANIRAMGRTGQKGYLYNPFDFGSTDPMLAREVNHALIKEGEKARTVLQSDVQLTWEKHWLVPKTVKLAGMMHGGGKPLEAVKKEDILIILGTPYCAKMS